MDAKHEGISFSFPANLLKVTFLSIQSVGIKPQGLILLGNTLKKEEVAKKTGSTCEQALCPLTQILFFFFFFIWNEALSVSLKIGILKQ